ncbi:MAG TPA: GNAT family N-acetyltransferase [Thermomicrobiales bacterium]|nr:GNAT family N-acetyltransferase [Thermomicrobiales bacterium]
MTNAAGVRFTERLRLEPIAAHHAGDLWRLHQDDRVAEWYAGRWSHERAAEMAESMGRQWADDGVGKWIAYHRGTGDLVGRGGLSRTRILDRDELEIGWAIRDAWQRRGYATEIGCAGLAFAFESLEATSVVAFTEVHNAASRAVMTRLGMEYEGEFRLPGLIAGSAVVQDDASFALYRIRHPGLPRDRR